MRALSPTYAHRAAAAAARGGIPVGRGRSVRAGSIGAGGVDWCGQGRFRVTDGEGKSPPGGHHRGGCRTIARVSGRVCASPWCAVHGARPHKSGQAGVVLVP